MGDYGVPAEKSRGGNAKAAVRDGEEAARDADEDARRDGQISRSRSALLYSCSRNSYARSRCDIHVWSQRRVGSQVSKCRPRVPTRPCHVASSLVVILHWVDILIFIVSFEFL